HEYDPRVGFEVPRAVSVRHLLAFDVCRRCHRCRWMPPYGCQACHAQRTAVAYQTEPGHQYVESQPRYLPQPEGGRHRLLRLGPAVVGKALYPARRAAARCRRVSLLAQRSGAASRLEGPRCRRATVTRSPGCRIEAAMTYATIERPATVLADRLDHSVSLICYGYNEEESIADFFERAVDLLESVVSDYEIVYVDDCSTDGTWQLAQRFARENSRIRIVQNHGNRNVGFSFKRGVSLAQKEYLFWQTIDWSYDLSDLRIFLELLDHFGLVVGVRPVPIRLLAYIPVVRSIYRVRTRSDDFIRAMV